MKKHVLIYADSLSWGIIPNSRKRLPFDARWPGVFELACNEHGNKVRVEENCLNGRRTAWEDPFKPGRDGSQGLAQVVEMHAPLDLIILMLGSNDFQRSHNNNAWYSAQGTAKLINIIRQAPIEPGMPQAEILVIAPPIIVQPKGAMAEKFADAQHKCQGLPQALAEVCQQLEVHFFDANTVVHSSLVDGIHLDAEQHLALGQALAQYVHAAEII